jgi:WD40 repeat protein
MKGRIASDGGARLRPIRIFVCSSGDMVAVFDPPGARVLTASDDHTARIWRVFPSVKALVEYARAIKPRALTPAQRKQFFPD